MKDSAESICPRMMVYFQMLKRAAINVTMVAEVLIRNRVKLAQYKENRSLMGWITRPCVNAFVTGTVATVWSPLVSWMVKLYPTPIEEKKQSIRQFPMAIDEITRCIPPGRQVESALFP